MQRVNFTALLQLSTSEIFPIHTVPGGMVATCQNASEKEIERVTSDGLIKMFVMDPEKRQTDERVIELNSKLPAAFSY